MTAILVLTAAALPTAQRIAAALPGASIHGLAGRIDGAATSFSDSASHIRALFTAGTPIIGLCAAGILIRALAPVLVDKIAEPPVLAVAPDGSAVIPLLGGHHGANALARRLAAALDCPAAITTAGDLALGLALDEPPPGWTIADPRAAKPVAAALLAGQSVRLRVEAGDAAWLSTLPTAPDAKAEIVVTDRSDSVGEALVFHPPVLVLGVGCERNTPPQDLLDLATQVLDSHHLARGAIACVASIDLKADEAAVHALAHALGVPARFFTAAELEAQAPRLVTPSDIVFQETGCHGVAEGAALAAAGDLLVPKVKSTRATLAIGRSATVLDPQTIGRARGRLFVVGIGPGAESWRTPESSAAIAASTDLVGYGMYLDLLGTAAAGKSRHESGLGAEADRARMALDLAAEGRVVSLVCSGDAGIYALATLVFELMDREQRPAWSRLEVSVVPGISALQAAAARAGAPINHDFCTISLSDLLTPWETIQHRLEAAAAADFVVCFYNPVSQRRRDQLSRARDILLIGRPAETPVILARQLGRPGETIEFITLGELTPDHADMLTMVVVGNSETRRFAVGGKEWVYTPRGYAKKL
jgi:cobalt-precorrin 5A hydrolase / precorrin-3B C17-methyltransferase